MKREEVQTSVSKILAGPREGNALLAAVLRMPFVEACGTRILSSIEDRDVSQMFPGFFAFVL